jgi:hypothetical protein
MTYVLVMELACVVVAVFLLFWAMENLAYPRSQDTVEAYPTDHYPRRRWMAIVVKAGLGLAMAALAAYLCIDVFYAEKKREDAVLEVRGLFNEKFGREPSAVRFDDNRANSRWVGWMLGEWELHGVAELEPGEVWDVAVIWTGSKVETNAQRRQ